MKTISRNAIRICAVTLLLVAIGACEDTEGASLDQVQELQNQMDELNATVDEIVQAQGEQVPSAEIVGETVTVDAAVEEVLDSSAFSVTGDDFWQFLEFEPSVLVVAPDPQMETLLLDELDEGDVVEINGTVQEFSIVSIEGETGLDLNDELYEEFENELAIVAEEVTVLD